MRSLYNGNNQNNNNNNGWNKNETKTNDGLKRRKNEDAMEIWELNVRKQNEGKQKRNNSENILAAAAAAAAASLHTTEITQLKWYVKRSKSNHSRLNGNYSKYEIEEK